MSDYRATVETTRDHTTYKAEAGPKSVRLTVLRKGIELEQLTIPQDILNRLFQVTFEVWEDDD